MLKPAYLINVGATAKKATKIFDLPMTDIIHPVSVLNSFSNPNNSVDFKRASLRLQKISLEIENAKQ